LDIGAGDGRWGIEAARHIGDAVIVGVERRSEEAKPEYFNYWYNQDFIKWQPSFNHTKFGLGFHLILSNPPFKIAEEIIRHAWPMLANRGTMIMLLPLNFMASAGRHSGLWSELPPVEVAVVSRRASFYGGGTDSREYAIYVWKKGANGESLGVARQWKTSLILHKRETDTGQDVRPGSVEQLTIF
jgi:hypothetical protein